MCKSCDPLDIYPTVHSAKCDILLGGESLVLDGVLNMELFTLGETVGVVNPLALALNNIRLNIVYTQRIFCRFTLNEVSAISFEENVNIYCAAVARVKSLNISRVDNNIYS